MFNSQKIAAAALAALALGFVGVATASTASASKADDKFVAILEEAGVGVDPADAAAIGTEVCAALDDGKSPATVEKELLEQNSGLKKGGAKAVVVASITAYCPEHEDLIDA